MATKKKTTRPRTSGKGTKKDTKKKTTTNKATKQKKGTSKKITYWMFAIAVAFMIFVCYEMHILQDLTPIEYVADIIKVALPIGIIAYMWRAVMEDKMELQLIYNEELSKGKQKYGDNYIIEELDEPEFMKRG